LHIFEVNFDYLQHVSNCFSMAHDLELTLLLVDAQLPFDLPGILAAQRP